MSKKSMISNQHQYHFGNLIIDFKINELDQGTQIQNQGTQTQHQCTFSSLILIKLRKPVAFYRFYEKYQCTLKNCVIKSKCYQNVDIYYLME